MNWDFFFNEHAKNSCKKCLLSVYIKWNNFSFFLKYSFLKICARYLMVFLCKVRFARRVCEYTEQQKVYSEFLGVRYTPERFKRSNIRYFTFYENGWYLEKCRTGTVIKSVTLYVIPVTIPKCKVSSSVLLGCRRCPC